MMGASCFGGLQLENDQEIRSETMDQKGPVCYKKVNEQSASGETSVGKLSHIQFLQSLSSDWGGLSSPNFC